jgi:hypothetical protein
LLKADASGTVFLFAPTSRPAHFDKVAGKRFWRMA